MSRLSDEEGDNETEQKAQISGIYHTTEKTMDNEKYFFLGRLMKAVRQVIASDGVPYLQMTSVESHCKERVGRKGWVIISTTSHLLSMETWPAVKRALG